MTRFLLIRHGTTDAVGRELSGRVHDVPLNALGRSQVQALAERLGAWQPSALYSSPLRRTVETAALLGERLRLAPQICAELNEIDFGRFAGRSFAELAGDERWREFNAFRDVARAPDGETMLEVQARVIAVFERLRARHSDAVIGCVSHADAIKAALAFFLGVSLDRFMRFEVAPASLSVVDLGGSGVQVRCINDGVAPQSG